jgi:hypothetical protein
MRSKTRRSRKKEAANQTLCCIDPQPAALIDGISLTDIPKTLQVGPLTFEEWNAELAFYFFHVSKLSFGNSAAQAMYGYNHFLIDQFLTVDQADLDACYEAYKEQGCAKIEQWSLTAGAFIDGFNQYMAEKLGQETECLRHYTFSFLGIRTAQATHGMRGSIPHNMLDSLNSQAWLGSPQIKVKLFY